MRVQTRDLTLDAYRGLAVVLMLFQHIPMYFHRDTESIYYLWMVIISRLSFPLFLLVAGYTIALSAKKRIAKYGRNRFLMHVGIRSLYLFILAIPLNIARGDHPLLFNALVTIAMGILLCAFLAYFDRKLLTNAVLALSIAFLSLAPKKIFLSDLSCMCNLFNWMMFYGEYPPMMWLIYPVFGYMLYTNGFKVVSSSGRYFLIGEAMVLFAPLFSLIGYGFDATANSLPFMSLIMGFILLHHGVFTYFVGYKDNFPYTKFLPMIGRHALFVYLSHLFLIPIILHLAPYTKDLTDDTSTMAILAVCAGYYYLLLVWEKIRDIQPRYV